MMRVFTAASHQVHFILQAHYPKMKAYTVTALCFDIMTHKRVEETQMTVVRAQLLHSPQNTSDQESYEQKALVPSQQRVLLEL